MNPSSEEMPQFELPPPPNEQAPATPGQSKERSKKPERAAAPERATSPPATLPSTPLPAQPVARSDDQAVKADDNSTTKNTKKPLLEDADLIEKEWVNKARRIVENTRNDPHKQSEELTVVKADYMKQHYGKTIKVK